MVFMGAVGLATGLVVRIGQELSSNVQCAKSIAAWCMGFAIVIGSVVATLLFWLRGYIVRIFTNDEQVIQVLSVNFTAKWESCVPISLTIRLL